MAALCFDASLETLRPLYYRGTHRLQGDFCRYFRVGSLETVQVVVTLLASHVLQNRPQPIVQEVEVCTSRRPIVGTDKGRNVPPQPLLCRLGFWAGTESCWKTHFWPLKRVMLSCFTTHCRTSSSYTRTPFSPPSCKLKMCHPLMGHLPSSHDVGRVMASLHTQNAHQGTFEQKSFYSACYTAPRWWKSLVREEDIFVSDLSVPLKETFCSCPSYLLQNRSKEVSHRAVVRSHV